MNLSRALFAQFVWLYRRSAGKFGGRIRGLSVLLLTTTGRRTGKLRTTPLGYFEHAGCFVICASNAGRDKHPAWFLNLKSRPEVRLEIGTSQMAATAEIAGASLRDEFWAELVQRAPGYRAYQQRTNRVIPMVLL